MKRTLSILFLCLAITSVNAERPIYRCFSGKLSHPKAEEVVRVDIALPTEAHESSLIGLIGFHNTESKFATDLHCQKTIIGRCGILDDGGSLDILKLSKDKMTIQFDGVPRLVIKGGQIDPDVDPKVKLKTPIRMILSEQPAAECAADSYSRCSRPRY